MYIGHPPSFDSSFPVPAAPEIPDTTHHVCSGISASTFKSNSNTGATYVPPFFFYLGTDLNS
ncbi:hypothetical protein B0H19DRAFT_1204439, partial [Mycena capillaripes]